MKDKFELTQEQILSKQYFRDAALWYDGKFIFPIVQRSILLMATFFLAICLTLISFQIKSQLAIATEMKYLINISGDVFANKVKIHTDSRADSNSLRFITQILCEDYLIKRENYDYEKLRDQIIYIQNTSTKSLFKSFYDSLDTKNSSSPLTLYQKYGKRNVRVTKFDFLDNNNVIIDYIAEARDMDNKIFATTKHRVKLSFESDMLEANMKNGSDYKFLVTSYKIQHKQGS